MLLTAVALLSRFNASRVSAGYAEYEINADYQKCGTSFFTDYIDYWSEDDLVGTCYYLDYSSSITLTVDNYKYTNPIFFCPSGASKIKFEPDDEIYCAEFNLNLIVGSDPTCGVYNTIYITTETDSFKTPVSASECQIGYVDLILAPVPSGTITIDGDYYMDNYYDIDNILALSYYSAETSTVNVTVSSSTIYTIKRSMKQRYSISIPYEGPYVFNGENGVVALSKLSVGAIAGIAVGAVVVVGAAVGVSVYFIIRNRNKEGKRSESSS